MSFANFAFGVDLISKIATVIGVPIAIWAAFVALKSIRKQSDLAAAAYSTQLVALASAFNQSIAESAEAASIWARGAADLNSLTDTETIRYTALIRNCMLVFENVVHQHGQGLLDETLYGTWLDDIRTFAKENHHRVLGELSNRYSPDLCALIREATQPERQSVSNSTRPAVTPR